MHSLEKQLKKSRQPKLLADKYKEGKGRGNQTHLMSQASGGAAGGLYSKYLGKRQHRSPECRQGDGFPGKEGKEGNRVEKENEACRGNNRTSGGRPKQEGKCALGGEGETRWGGGR